MGARASKHLGNEKGNFLSKEGSSYKRVGAESSCGIAYWGIKNTITCWLRQHHVRHWKNYLDRGSPPAAKSEEILQIKKVRWTTPTIVDDLTYRTYCEAEEDW